MDKKFPTPNLDAVAKDEYGWCPIELAAQADIALTVEAARTVSNDVIHMLKMAVEFYASVAAITSTRKAKTEAAYRWLESLTVAPKEAPPQDKRCGTCAHYLPVNVTDGGKAYGHCDPPSPDCFNHPTEYEHSGLTYEDKGNDCPCWKAKP